MITITEKTYGKMPDDIKAMFKQLPNPSSEEVRECFPESNSSPRTTCDRRTNSNHEYGFKTDAYSPHNDSGNSSRFFKSIIYQPKASKAERGQGNGHPTVKPLKLMEYLIKMITPAGGVVLDPFAGSGTTGIAAKRLGYNYILIEKEAEYIEIIKARLSQLKKPQNKQTTMF